MTFDQRAGKGYRRSFKLAVLVALASLVAPLIAAAAVPLPNPATIRSAVVAASNFKNIGSLSNLTPSLPELVATFTSPNPNFGSHRGCYLDGGTATLQADWVSQCAYGQTNAQRAVLVFGDSTAWNWLSTFDAWGYLNGWRVIFVVHTSCAPWKRPWLKSSTMLGTVTQGKCEQWASTVLSAIADIRPIAVFPIGIEYEINNNPALPHSSVAQIATTISSLATTLRQLHTTAVLLQPFPSYAWSSTALACVTQHPANVQSCEMKTSAVPLLLMNKAYARAAITSKVTQVSTLNWFCGPTYCPLVVPVGGVRYLTYHDGYHINPQFAQLLAPTLASDLTRILGTGPLAKK